MSCVLRTEQTPRAATNLDFGLLGLRVSTAARSPLPATGPARTSGGGGKSRYAAPRLSPTAHAAHHLLSYRGGTVRSVRAACSLRYRNLWPPGARRATRRQTASFLSSSVILSLLCISLSSYLATRVPAALPGLNPLEFVCLDLNYQPRAPNSLPTPSRILPSSAYSIILPCSIPPDSFHH